MLTVLEYICDKWHLKVNYKKSSVPIFNNKNSKTDNSKIIVGCGAYSVKTKMKYLGINKTIPNNNTISAFIQMLNLVHQKRGY